MNIINAVVAELTRRGYVAYNEHPGVVHVPTEHCGFWTSDQNNTWTIDLQTLTGEYLYTWDTKVSAYETDVTVIADAIATVIGQPRLP